MKLDTILKLVLFFLISLTLHFALVSADSLSSDSQNISEWRMDGRTLNGTRFYPGPIPSDLSQLQVITNATGDFTGDPTVADGFMYGISLRDRIYKRNASNITILIDRTADHTLFQYPVQPLWNGFVYAGDEYGNIYQYNTSNLSQIIATNGESVPQHYSSPIIYKGFIYFTDWWSTSGPIFQANASNVTQVIARFYVSSCQAAPVIQNDFLYYGCGTRIYQLNATNITKSIANYTAGGSFSTASGLAVTDSYLYFGTSDDKLYQLNASNITIFVANYTTGNNINIPPAVGHGFVYIGSTDGYTYQLNASNVSHQIANYSTGSVPEGLTVTSDYLLASGSKLYQLNALNISQQISNYSVSSSGSPVVANGIIYFSSSVSFYQLGTDIPIVTLNSPAAGYQLSQSTEAVTFNCTALDNSGLVNISLYLTDSGNTNFLLNQTTNISGAGNTTAWTLNLVRGNYTWNCLAYDTDGNNAFSTNRTISEDKSAPSLSISSPVNNSYSSNTTLKIIYTASDSYLSTCWFSNDSMLVNTTIAECASIADVTWSEGQHNLTLWANDTSGNMNSTTRRFSIDTIIPSIDITVPTNNTNSTNNRQNINATKSDLNRASCWYSNDSMLVNTTLASCANITTVTWSEGQHNVTMWVNDSAGNKNSSLVSFYLDSKSPALNVTYPINNTNWTNNLLMVNYTLSDINLQSCWYSNDSMLVNTTLTGCANITTVTWSEGQHNVTVWGNDSLGNVNKSSVRFSIDSTGPAFTTLSNQSVSYNTSFSYTLAASDSSGVNCYRVNDTSRFSLSCSGLLKNNTLLDIGLYWLNITTNDTLGLETSAVMFVNVTLDPTISLTLITPTADINVTQNQTFTVSVTVSCNYADCGEVNVSLDPEISDNMMALNTKVTTDDNSSGSTAFLSSDLESTSSKSALSKSTLSESTSVESTSSGSSDLDFLLSEPTDQLSPEQKPEESESSYTTLSAISLYDNKSFEYDIQDGCSILDGNTDTFDSGMVLKINTTAFTGTRSTTEDEGREAFCNAQNMSSMNVSRKVYVSALGNFSRYLEILHNPRQTEVCVSVQISSNMGSDGSDFMNTSDYNETWKMLDHWMMWDDTTAAGGDSAAGFVYQQDGATETVDSFSPTTASGGSNSYTWNNVCVPAGGTRIFMHFFTQMASRVQAEIESDALYTAFSDSSHTTGMSTTEMSQVVNWALTIPQTKSGLVSMNTSATPFYTTTQNPYNVTLTANQTATITWTVNATGTMNQSYTFFVYANRTSNMSVSAITSQWNVTIINGSSLSAPSITIGNPSNNSYTSNNQLNINYSVTYDTLNSCWYSNDSMLVNTTLTGCTNITTVTWSEGQHNVTIYANDTSGNVGSSTVRFTLDRTNPSLILSSPTNASLSTDSGLDVLYSVSDTNLASCWYNNDSMFVNTTLTGCANITTVTWSEAQHNVTIWVNDSAGNSNTTSVRFTLDSLNPAISVSSPTNDSSSNNSGLDVLYSVSDTNLASCWYSNDSMLVNTTLTGCANITAVTWSEGQHNVTIWANDSFGNNNKSSVRFSIDSSSITLTISSPENNTYTSSQGLDVLYTTSGNNRASCWYNNDSMLVNTTLTECANITDVTWSEGQHNVTIFVNNTAGTTSSASVRFTADITAPNATLETPAHSSVVNGIGQTSISFNCTVADTINLANVSLYLTNSSNGSFSLNRTTSLSGTRLRPGWTLNVGSGNYTWNCLVADSAANSNWSSSNYTFRVNSTSDTDGDNLSDISDPLFYNESNVTSSGLTLLNISIGGNRTNGTFAGRQPISFYDDSSLVLNFSHNFTQSNLDLSKVSIVKTSTSLIINLSGQLQSSFNKSVYITDNSFVSLCVKDGEVSSIDEVSSACTGSNETDFTSCLGNSLGVTLNSLMCTDLGSTIVVDNLRYSAVKGTQAGSSSSSSSSSSSGGGGGGGGLSKKVEEPKKAEGEASASKVIECNSNTECSSDKVCYDHQCVKLFDIKIIDVETSITDEGLMYFTYFIKGMANISGDVVVDFWIEKVGASLASGTDTIYLGSFDAKAETAKIYVPKTMEGGEYSFNIRVTFENYQALSHRTIFMEETEDGMKVNLVGQGWGQDLKTIFLDLSWLWMFIVLVLMLFIFALGLGFTFRKASRKVVQLFVYESVVFSSNFRLLRKSIREAFLEWNEARKRTKETGTPLKMKIQKIMTSSFNQGEAQEKIREKERFRRMVKGLIAGVLSKPEYDVSVSSRALLKELILKDRKDRFADIKRKAARQYLDRQSLAIQQRSERYLVEQNPVELKPLEKKWKDNKALYFNKVYLVKNKNNKCYLR